MRLRCYGNLKCPSDTTIASLQKRSAPVPVGTVLPSRPGPPIVSDDDARAVSACAAHSRSMLAFRHRWREHRSRWWRGVSPASISLSVSPAPRRKPDTPQRQKFLLNLDGRGVSRVSCHSAGAQQMTPTGHGHHSGPCGSVRVSCGCHQFHLVVSRDTDTWLLPRDGERRCGGWIGTSAAEL